MNMMIDPQDPLAKLLRKDRRYHFDAYVFVFEALRYAQEKLGMGSDPPAGGDLDDVEGGERHVTGQDLCEAIRRYANEQYGLMAQSVLNHWGIQSTGDLGEIVFNLIEIGKMRKTPDDRREDFENVFDLGEALREGFHMCSPDSSEESRS